MLFNHALILLTIGASLSRTPPVEDPVILQYLASGIQLLQSHNPDRASSLLVEVIRRAKDLDTKKRAAELLATHPEAPVTDQIVALEFLTTRYPKDQEYLQWLYQLGSAYFDQNQFSKSAAIFRKISNNSLADLKLAFSLWNLREKARSCELFAKISKTASPEIRSALHQDLARIWAISSPSELKLFTKYFSATDMSSILLAQASTHLHLKWLRFLTSTLGIHSSETLQYRDALLSTTKAPYPNIQQSLKSLRALINYSIPSEFSDLFVESFSKWNTELERSVSDFQSLPRDVQTTFEPFFRELIFQVVGQMISKIKTLSYTQNPMKNQDFRQKQREIILALKKTYLSTKKAPI